MTNTNGRKEEGNMKLNYGESKIQQLGAFLSPHKSPCLKGFLIIFYCTYSSFFPYKYQESTLN